MNTANRKPPAGTPTAGRRTSTDPPTPPAKGPARSTTPTTTAANGIARNRSIRSSAPTRRPGAGASSLSQSNGPSDAEDEARAETVALLDDLKERLHKAETASEQFQKQAQVLQSRLDEALQEQGKLEDRLHESDEKLEALENQKREALRQRREMEAIYEAERGSMTKEREEMATREEEMQTIIQRLKDNLTARSNTDEESRLSRRSNNSSPSLDNSTQFAPPSGLNRSDSRNNSKLLLQKDKLIESLRLELAEAQIKLVESENMGGGRMQEVEKLLLEARMTNARLMEDNESYQLLLSEKTLTGDFSKSEFMGSAANQDALSALEGRTAVPSLADELSEADEGESDSHRKLEAELKSARDQNKALTLYINKIIERLLQHQDFEAILDQSSEFKPGATNTQKELPPPPPQEQASGASILQRAKSVAMGAARRPRPQSVLQPSTVNEDPETAPSIPFGLSRTSSFRTGSRPKSEQYTGGAANVVNQMYRGGQTSPPLPSHGPQTPRNSSFFANSAAGGNPNAAHRVPSGNQVPTTGNFPGMKSESSSDSGDVSTPPSQSPPREKAAATSFAGNKPRPLRLVQDHPENGPRQTSGDKRSSWMGWAFGKKEEPAVMEERIKE